MPALSLPTTWTITCGGVTVSAAEIGVTDITRHRVRAAADTCVIHFDGRAFDDAPPFAPGATVTVAREGVGWFAGRVTSAPVTGDERAEAQVCALTGPWWYLAQIVCQQPWQIQGGAATAWTSRLVLGQADDGSALTTGQVITAALQYAIDAGAPLAIGTVEPAFLVPLDEVKDVTCAEVIEKMLRWHPDVVAWFDYAATPVPTFHCRARASLPAATLTVGAPPLAAVRGLTARHDLQVPAVVFHYETTSRAGGQVHTDVVTDAAPVGATGREFGAVVGTIPLRGETSVLVSQRIVTQPIASDPDGPGLVEQLAGQSAVLAVYAADPAITAAGITITSLHRTAAPAPGTGGGSGGVGTELTGPPDLTLENALIEGQITDWMIADHGLNAQTQRLTFSYTLERADDGGGGSPEVSAPQQASIVFTATDAASGLYTTLSPSHPGDTVPTGLAAASLAAWSTLQYSGEIVLVEPEAGGAAANAAGLGTVINLAGGAVSAWAEMRAVVAAETVSVAAGTTTLTLGPSGHGSAVGLAAVLATTRAGASGRVAGSPAVRGTASSASRATGTPG